MDHLGAPERSSNFYSNFGSHSLTGRKSASVQLHGEMKCLANLFAPKSLMDSLRWILVRFELIKQIKPCEHLFFSQTELSFKSYNLIFV